VPRRGPAPAVAARPRVGGGGGGGPDPYEALAARYGHAAHDVLALAAERGELAQTIVEGLPDLLAEVALAARREQARSIGDVLLRRTRLGLLAARALSDGPVRRVGAVIARELAWSEERLELELSRFAEEAGAEGLLGDGRTPTSVPAAGAPPAGPTP